MSDLTLSFAAGAYEHVRDLTTGAVKPNGINLVSVHGVIEDVLFRSHWHREWDVAEIGLGAHVLAVSKGEDDIVGIPVFTSRVFRHSAIYVRADSKIEKPTDLHGKRIGVPEWGMAAAVWARGILADEHGFDFRQARWFQGGLHDKGRPERMPPAYVKGLDYTNVRDGSLNDLLVAGELDAIFTARAPNAFTNGDGKVRHLFANLQQEELAYWRRSGIIPIMHFVGIRRDVYEKNRWIAVELLRAFEQSKNRSLERARDIVASFFPVPLMHYAVDDARSVMGEDYWPYGIEANRSALDAYTRYCFEQGITKQKVEVDDLFAPETRFTSRT